jgi:omega-6 fatty acid desaturase (delta-12 desaturase)
VAVSVLGVSLSMAASAAACYYFGPSKWALFYFLPYLVVNFNLVLITYLQHTDKEVPHFFESKEKGGEPFDFLRGALCTADRSYGWLLDHVFHHISDTHVVHHICHTMPFYHAVEATLAVKKVLGEYYLSDHTPIPLALYNSFRECRFIEDKGPVAFYQNVDAFNAGLKKKV